ncbi:winged helix-turn-helix domain-containing protein [Lysinibacillus xylanilyticus]|uniref:winged helix-turn-helix domain-containing protein n=1 Tax=Lysinibacillus xylanilyticus TaxID=582475 RepID=UPI003D039A6C
MSTNLLPSCSEIYTPLLSYLYFKSLHGQFSYTVEVYSSVGDELMLSSNQRKLKMEDGRNHWENRVQSAKGNLVKKGYVYNVIDGCWSITEEGINYFLSNTKWFHCSVIK